MHLEISKLFDMSGKIALITGGARHLGFDAASVLAAAGSDIAITSRSDESARAASGLLKDRYGVEVLPLALDQSDPDSVREAFGAVQRWRGRLDVLVNNAGGTIGESPSRLL
jgi:gluconate 5-dehydrogenase